MSSEDGNRPVRNSELKAELRAMRLEFRLWLVIGITVGQVFGVNALDVAKAVIAGG